MSLSSVIEVSKMLSFLSALRTETIHLHCLVIGHQLLFSIVSVMKLVLISIVVVIKKGIKTFLV